MVNEIIFRKLAKSKQKSQIKLSRKELKIIGNRDSCDVESYAKRILNKRKAEIKTNFNVSGNAAVSLIEEDIFQQLLKN